VRQMLVRLLRAVRSAFHLNTVKGRVQILHSSHKRQPKLISGKEGQLSSESEGFGTKAKPRSTYLLRNLV
jgi:hypothetical protein